MMKELFRLPALDVPIYGYGLMLVIGLLAAMYLAGWMARRVGLNPDLFYNAAILAIVSGIVGARISHVLENLSIYTSPNRSAWENFLAAINIRSGGLTYYGGFLLAFPTLILYALRKKVPLALGMDIVAPALMVGLAFGRIGCLLNGCCWGQTCDMPWAITFPFGSYAYLDEYERNERTPPTALMQPLLPGEQRPPLVNERRLAADPALRQLAAGERSFPRHPTQIYSFVMAMLIAAVTFTFFWLPHVPGRGFAMMLVLEGAARFTIESLRVEPRVLGPLSFSMVIAAGLVVLGVTLWFACGAVHSARSAKSSAAGSAA